MTTSFSAMDFGCPSLGIDFPSKDSVRIEDVRGDEENEKGQKKNRWARLIKKPFSAKKKRTPIDEKGPEEDFNSNSENICAMDLDLAKVQEEFKFVHNEVILEELYLPLQEDVTNLRRRINDTIFPNKRTRSKPLKETVKTPMGLAREIERKIENCFHDDLESEGYEVIPKLASEMKIGVDEQDDSQPQHISIKGPSPREKNGNKVIRKRLSKGLGKTQPKTIYVEKLTKRESQVLHTKEIQHKKVISDGKNRAKKDGEQRKNKPDTILQGERSVALESGNGSPTKRVSSKPKMIHNERKAAKTLKRF